MLDLYMSDENTKVGVLQGTLDLLILKTLDSLGTQHGYGIARRIEQMSADTLELNQGTLHPALLRLEQRGFVRSEIGVSETKRRARFYTLTAEGRRQLHTEIGTWQKLSATVNAILGEPTRAKA